MRTVNKISEKKQALIDQLNASSIAIGEIVYIKDNKDRDVAMVVESIDGDTIIAYDREYPKQSTKTFSIKDITHRYKFEIGANPFDERFESIRMVAYTLESILFNLNILGEKKLLDDSMKTENGVPIKELNWNPFVYNKNGEKEYYQRPFVWLLEDKQNLIESIYNGIDCGKILVRSRSWKDLDAMGEKGETEVYFHDLVDGKQRLEAIRGFIMGEYPDAHGNYFADLSFRAQNHFTNHQLFSYAVMPETTTDEEVLIQFLKLNFAGVPQSKEHIAFVKSLTEKL